MPPVPSATQTLLRDYRPYDPARLSVRRLPGDPPNPAELENMNRKVLEVLDTMTVAEYTAARGGLDAQVAYIRSVLDAVDLRGVRRALEFGAGTAKVSALLTLAPGVEEVWANDFSEPLLTEIAPRVVSYVGGDLGKVRLLVGDMNRLPDLDERFDLVVCYYAVHHLVLPEHFLHRLGSVLTSRGRVLCVREPALPALRLPTPSIRQTTAAVARLRREGENENLYTVAEYRAQGEPGFRSRLLMLHDGRRALPRVAQWAWKSGFDVAYVLERR